MTTLLPQDLNDNPIPALRMKRNGAHTISVNENSATNTTGFDTETQIVSVYADVPVYLSFGDSNVSATPNDHFLPAGLYYDVSIGGDHSAHYSHIAVLQVSEAGTLFISEKE